MAHTYVLLEVSKECYEEVETKLKEAGYGHAFFEEEDGVVIDMHGIALQVEGKRSCPDSSLLNWGAHLLEEKEDERTKSKRAETIGDSD